MAVLEIAEGVPYPVMRSGDTWLFTGGHFPGLLVRGVYQMTFRRADGASECVFSAVDVPGEYSCWARVMDRCPETTLDGLEGSGGYHGIRITGSNACKVVRCASNHNYREGLIAGFADDIEIGWCSFNSNGLGNQSADKAHGCYVSEHTKRAWIHDCGASLNMGSGVQLNGTPEDGGVLYAPKVERVVLEGNGGRNTGTPNLSLIACQDGVFDQVSTKGGRGAMRLFTYGGGAACERNVFAACEFDALGCGFSCEFLERTVDTTFDVSCVVRGPDMRADASSELPRWV